MNATSTTKIKTIALVGNPNCGKTTLFNNLTGARQRVGNWPGVTVERKTGDYQHADTHYQVIDLPGTYSISSDPNTNSEGDSLDELIASQEGQYQGIWNHDKDSGPWHPPIPKFKFTAKNLYKKMRRGELNTLTGWVGVLPQGGFDMSSFVKLIDRVKISEGENAGWVNHKHCWLVAVDDQSGERMAFGRDRDNSSDIDLSQAVCASYGVPGWCPPINIKGKTYIDGGVVSPCSADMLVDTDIDEVIVLVPMASSIPDQPWSWFKKIERKVRKGMTAIVDEEVALLEAAGKKVIRIEPTADDLAAFGYNMMDPRRRERVYSASQKSSPDNVKKSILKGLNAEPI